MDIALCYSQAQFYCSPVPLARKTELDCRRSLPQPVVTVFCSCPMGQSAANTSTSPAGRALSRQMEKLLSRALVPSTSITYQTGIKRYYDFCSIHQWKPLPGTTQTLALFVTDLSMTLQPRTIQVYISAVSYLHHMNSFTSPANNNPVIKLLIQGIHPTLHASSPPHPKTPTDNKQSARADAITTGQGSQNTSRLQDAQSSHHVGLLRTTKGQ